MKSSTVRRSALSRESMDIIENLSNENSFDYNSQYSYNSDYSAPSEYYRESIEVPANNKSKEIDLLWQTFKSAQFNTNSPFMHALGGFVLGVILTCLSFALFGMFVANSDNVALKNKFSMSGVNAPVEDISSDTEEIAETKITQHIPTDESNDVISSEETKIEKNNKKTSKKIAKETNTPVETKKYIIKDGDTVEAIIKRNYGSYTPERAEAIMKANNLKDLDHISIDQELLLPIEQ